MSARAMRLVAGIALLAPRAALACAVCGGGNPANRFAFFASTIALSLLPLGMFAGAFLWLRARLRGRVADEFVERDALKPVERSRTREAPPATGEDARIPNPPER